jgi:hypothetical protein
MPSSDDGLQRAQHAEEGGRREGLQGFLALLVNGAEVHWGATGIAGRGAAAIGQPARRGQHGLQAAAVLVQLLLHDALIVGARALDHRHGQAADAAERHLQ